MSDFWHLIDYIYNISIFGIINKETYSLRKTGGVKWNSSISSVCGSKPQKYDSPLYALSRVYVLYGFIPVITFALGLSWGKNNGTLPNCLSWKRK